MEQLESIKMAYGDKGWLQRLQSVIKVSRRTGGSCGLEQLSSCLVQVSLAEHLNL